MVVPIAHRQEPHCQEHKKIEIFAPSGRAESNMSITIEHKPKPPHVAFDKKQGRKYLLNAKPHEKIEGRGCARPVENIPHLIQQRKVTVNEENIPAKNTPTKSV